MEALDLAVALPQLVIGLLEFEPLYLQLPLQAVLHQGVRNRPLERIAAEVVL